MKKFNILLFFIVINTSVFAQQAILNRALIDKNRSESAFGKMLEYNDITGTPYLNKNFLESKIADNYKNIAIRYNAFKDYIEYEDTEKQLMILPKEHKFKKIEVTFPKQIIVLEAFENETLGYYFEVLVGKYSLYKKIKINFIDSKPISSPYGTEEAASFSKPIATYYIVSDGKVIRELKTKKDIQQFSKSNHLINNFVKENKTKFEKEEDLKKLVAFLNNHL